MIILPITRQMNIVQGRCLSCKIKIRLTLQFFIHILIKIFAHGQVTKSRQEWCCMYANNRRKDTFAIILALCITAAFVIYLVCGYRAMGDFNDILNNPTFTGTVIRKGTTEPSASGSSGTLYLLHITGMFTVDDRPVLVDNIFIVPAEIHRRFEVGDTLSHKLVKNYYCWF